MFISPYTLIKINYKTFKIEPWMSKIATHPLWDSMHFLYHLDSIFFHLWWENFKLHFHFLEPSRIFTFFAQKCLSKKCDYFEAMSSNLFFYIWTSLNYPSWHFSGLISSIYFFSIVIFDVRALDKISCHFIDPYTPVRTVYGPVTRSS